MYEERGAGESFVLLHRFGGCSQLWLPLTDRLAEHFRLIVPDLRGHGRSANPAGTFTHRQSAADIFALLDQLGVTRFKAMGTSSGGMTLLHKATRQPSRVEAMGSDRCTHYFPEEARAATLRCHDAVRRPSGSSHVRCAGMLRRGNWPSSLATSRQLRRHELHGAIPGDLTARTLIVHSDRDPLFPLTFRWRCTRVIPLNDSAFDAVERMLKRAEVPRHSDPIALAAVNGFLDARRLERSRWRGGRYAWNTEPSHDLGRRPYRTSAWLVSR